MLLQLTTLFSDDFVASIGANRSENGEELIYARQKIVAHAAADSMQSIDMVWIDFNNLEGLRSKIERNIHLMVLDIFFIRKPFHALFC